MTMQGTFTARYVDPPKGGKGPARIKDTDNVVWKYWTTGKKPLPFETFVPGGTYVVAYRIDKNDYGEDRIISAVASESAPEVSYAPPAPKTNGHAAPSGNGNGNTKDRSIYEQALLKEFIHCGNIPLDEDAIAGAITIIQRAYDRTHT